MIPNPFNHLSLSGQRRTCLTGWFVLGCRRKERELPKQTSSPVSNHRLAALTKAAPTVAPREPENTS